MQKDNIVLSIFKGVLVLSIIALVCTVLLGAVNIFTQIDPLQAAYEKFAQYSNDKKFTKMIVEDGWQGANGKLLYYAQSTDGTTNAFLSQGNGGYGGPVEVYVIVNVQEKTIEKVELGEHSETFVPNLNKANFFEKFIGKDITNFQTDSVATVTGATLSSTAILKAVYTVADYYAENPTLVADQTQNTGGTGSGTTGGENSGENNSQQSRGTTNNNGQDIGANERVKAIVKGQLQVQNINGYCLKNKGGVL